MDKFPPFNLLKPGNKLEKDNTEELQSLAQKLQETLRALGAKVTVAEVSQGPTVTRYGLVLEPGVKVWKINNWREEIKLCLGVADIRIDTPIPGKSVIGIEVPNKDNTMITLRELFESRKYRNADSKLAFTVGKDIEGQIIVADLDEMSHILIGGSIKSGKSTFINTMIVSILYKARPDEVKFIMIDSSAVDLSVYNGIPHLLIPVVTDVKKALETLQGVVSEMEKRQHRFAEIGVRNLKDYNEKIVNMPCAEGPKRQKTLPQLVIIINDLSDLMMEGYKEIEESVWRLALNASTVGIHLVISTQYSGVEVFTGLLKASIRSRVAFAVSKRIESRMILDMEGAEKLLGKGDMLFYPQGYMKPIRIQGAFVSDEEIGKVVDFIKDQKLTTDLDDTVKSETPGIVLGLGGVLNCIKFM